MDLDGYTAAILTAATIPLQQLSGFGLNYAL